MSSWGGVGAWVVVLLDYSRARQALLSVAQPALGALLAAGAFPPLRTVWLGLVAATAGFLCVFAANDLFDRNADRQELARRGSSPAPQRGAGVPEYDVDVIAVRHPLAAGALPLWAGTAWVSVLGLSAFGAAWALRPLCALVFLACFALEFTYCGLKRRSWLKTLPAGAMVGLGGLAGWFAVGGSSWGALAFFLLLTVWEIAGRNLSNDLADASSDAPLGIATVATRLGPDTAARAILVGALLMPFIAFVQPGGVVLRAALAAGAVVSMTAPAVRLALRTSESQAVAYFNRASLYPAVAFTVVTLLMVV